MNMSDSKRKKLVLSKVSSSDLKHIDDETIKSGMGLGLSRIGNIKDKTVINTNQQTVDGYIIDRDKINFIIPKVNDACKCFVCHDDFKGNCPAQIPGGIQVIKKKNRAYISGNAYIKVDKDKVLTCPKTHLLQRDISMYKCSFNGCVSIAVATDEKKRVCLSHYKNKCLINSCFQKSEKGYCNDHYSQCKKCSEPAYKIYDMDEIYCISHMKTDKPDSKSEIAEVTSTLVIDCEYEFYPFRVCSFACYYSLILSQSILFKGKYSFASLFYDLTGKHLINKRESLVKPSPNIMLLKDYGGSLSREEYRGLLGNVEIKLVKHLTGEVKPSMFSVKAK